MRTKTIIASILLFLATIVFAILDNEIIFPATMVGFFLTLIMLAETKKKRTIPGKSAQYAIITFSLIMIALNVLVSVFLPIIADHADLTAYFGEQTTETGVTGEELEGHFVEVLLNDMHESCYIASFLLIVNGIYLLAFNAKNKMKK